MIKLIDSSIRDGGNVNDWNFGKRAIKGIVQNLVDSNIDIVELGYLQNVVYSPDKTLYNSVTEAKTNLPDNKGSTEFSLMIQEDKWDWSKLEKCDGTIQHIRVSFHKFDIAEGLELCKMVMSYGYICHCNPINIMGYNDKELLELIGKINDVHPNYFTIVDTFGSMTIDDLKRIDSLLNNNLVSDIKLSAHLHENLGLAYSLAQEFITYFESKRDIFIDASIYGIGRVPGNLCQELIMNFLINERNADYNIDPIYDAIDDFIVSIKKKNPWGYALPYALSATYNLHRTYPEYLMGKGKLRTKDIKAILNSVIPSEKVIYNKSYIESLYQKYINVDADDSNDFKNIMIELAKTNVLIVAPGKSIVEEKEKIMTVLGENSCKVISVNFDGNYLTPDFCFYTNPKRYRYDADKLDAEKVIATSNLLRDSVKAKYIFNYQNLSSHGGVFNEDSVLMLLKLVETCKVRKVFIAGFDGFSVERKHFDDTMDLDYLGLEHDKRVKDILSTSFDMDNIVFITESVYKND